MKLKTQLIFTTFLLTATCILFGACDREDWYADGDLLLTDEMHGSLRNGNVVATGGVKDVTFNSATILFSANYNYKESIEIEPGIIYSDVEFNPDVELNSSNYSNKAKATYVKVSNFANSALEITLDNLKPNTTYYYCAYASSKNHGSTASHHGRVGSFKTPPDYSPGEAVDLGLSVKWASKDIGATDPLSAGLCFCWGGTAPNGRYSLPNEDLSVLKFLGYVDDNNNLTSAYDAATQIWGSKWRMPTKEEFQELHDKCTWIKSGPGYKVIGANKNYIYLDLDYWNHKYWTSTGSNKYDYDKYSTRYYQAYYFEFPSSSWTMKWDRELLIRPVLK